MTLIGFALWLAIPFGGPALGPIDVGATVVVESDAAVFRRTPIALPHVIVLYPHVTPAKAVRNVRHELEHTEQWDALGPGFLVAYAVGLGHGFEYYLGDGAVWHPPAELQRRCPLLRVPPNAPAQFMPCWRW